MRDPYSHLKDPAEVAEQDAAREVAEETGLGLVQVSSRRWLVVDRESTGGSRPPGSKRWLYSVHYRRLSRPIAFDAAMSTLHRLLKEARESPAMGRAVRGEMAYALSRSGDLEA